MDFLPLHQEGRSPWCRGRVIGEYMELSYKEWGEYEGQTLYLFRLTASDGAYVELTNWGATWVSACMPDAHGHLADVLLGYPSSQGYIDDTCYIGATVGRYANRIARARVCIEGVEYKLEANDGENTNHGGFHGWNRRVWGWKQLAQGVRFTLVSPHLEGGFPGEAQVEVDYCFDDNHILSLCHRVVTDRTTYINMTNHAYFNLSGEVKPIDDHLLRICSDTMLDTDASFIPTGKLLPVEGTLFDFTCAHAIGDNLHKHHQQLEWNRGYNHCYVLGEPGIMRRAAVLSHLASGRKLSVDTTLPAVLFYSAGFLPGVKGKQGMPMLPSTGVCLETQFYPDAPSHPAFPSTLLRCGETYSYMTNYKFDIL